MGGACERGRNVINTPEMNWMEICEQKCKSYIIRNKISKPNKLERAVMMNEELFLYGLIRKSGR